MKEITFKELTSLKSRTKNILLKEVFENGEVLAKTERRTFYFIKDIGPLNEGSDLKNSKRHFHILREHNERLGEDKIICKILGTIYVVAGKMVYTIVFLNSFKASFVRPSLAQ